MIGYSGCCKSFLAGGATPSQVGELGSALKDTEVN